MSYDAFAKNDGAEEGNQSPQNNQNPYGAPQQSQAPQSGSPYASPYGTPQQAYNQPQTPGYPQPQQSGPYAYSQAPTGETGASGFNIFGLTWEKNVVRQPNNGHTTPSAKSVGLAYVLWFFLGWIGVHQFYLGNTARGLFNLALWAVTAFLGLFFFVFPLIFTAYWIYEAVTLNDQTQEVNNGYIRKSIL